MKNDAKKRKYPFKAIWRGEDDPLCGLAYGKEYEILGDDLDGTYYGVVDETGDSYLYPAEDFEIIDPENQK